MIGGEITVLTWPTNNNRREEMPLKLIKNAYFAVLLLFSVSALSTADEAMEKQGEALFNQNCVFCHQADGIGKAGFAPSLTNKELLATASDKFFLTTIRDGRAGTGMPPFAHLGKNDIESLVAYFRSFSELPYIGDEVDAQKDAHGDPNLGKVWFDQICSTCHGVDGDGYNSGGTGTAIGNASFLSKVSDGFLRTTIKNGRSNTRMLGFSGPEGLANLSDQEIDDVIVYLRKLAK